jgi:hypothetical protein
MKGLAGRSGIVAVGIAGSGLGSLAMLAVISHQADSTPFAAFATWWIVATLIVYPLGVFESVLARHLIADIAGGRPTAGTTGAIIGRSGLFVLVAVALCVGLDGYLADTIFRGSNGLGYCLAAFLIVSLVQTAQRGNATGTDRFSLISTQLVLDGALRAIGAAVGVLVDPNRPALVAVLVCGGSFVAAAITHLLGPDWWQRPRWRESGLDWTTIATLLVSASGPILINNASVPWFSGHGGSALAVGSLAGALTLARIPVQFGSSVFGPLLHQLSTAIEADDRRLVRDVGRRSIGLAAGAAATFTVAYTIFGRLMIAVFLGDEHTLPTWAFTLLGASSGAMLVAVVVQVNAAAHQAWRGIAVSWIAAGAVFFASLLVPGSLLFQACLAPTAASFAGLLALVITARRNRTHRDSRAAE